MKRKCPECAETIQAEAKKCKHCGASVEPEKKKSVSPRSCLLVIAVAIALFGTCIYASSRNHRVGERHSAGRIPAAPAADPQPAPAQPPEFEEGKDFEVLETWAPHPASEAPKPRAYGADVVIAREMSLPELTRLVAQLQQGHDPFVTYVYRSKRAWMRCRKNASANAWKLPICRKQELLTANSYGGNGKITWLGPFGDEGQTTF